MLCQMHISDLVAIVCELSYCSPGIRAIVGLVRRVRSHALPASATRRWRGRSALLPANLMDTVSGPGFSTGVTAWLRYDPIWLGVRLGYSTYDLVDILTLTGEPGAQVSGQGGGGILWFRPRLALALRRQPRGSQSRRCRLLLHEAREGNMLRLRFHAFGATPLVLRL